MQGQCIAYREDGTICGQPASILDTQRGSMICELCAETARRRAALHALAEATSKPADLVAWAGAALQAGSPPDQTGDDLLF